MSLLDALSKLCERFDEVRASLRWAAAAADGTESERRVAREVTASSFVAVSGALEQFFRRYVEWLANEVQASGIPFGSIRLSIHAIVASDEFRSLQTLRDPERMFLKRIALLERTTHASPCTVSLRHDELGIDGETIRPAHADNVWRLFGLPGPAFASVRQQVALRVFADNRNDYAHGKVTIDEFLQNPECHVNRILGRLSDLEAWCFHCWSVADDYLTSQGYLR